jgi:hypothetical protein
VIRVRMDGIECADDRGKSRSFLGANANKVEEV